MKREKGASHNTYRIFYITTNGYTQAQYIERKWSVKVLLERSRIAGGLLLPLVLYTVLISFCLLIPYTTSHYNVTTTTKFV